MVEHGPPTGQSPAASQPSQPDNLHKAPFCETKASLFSTLPIRSNSTKKSIDLSLNLCYSLPCLPLNNPLPKSSPRPTVLRPPSLRLIAAIIGHLGPVGAPLHQSSPHPLLIQAFSSQLLPHSFSPRRSLNPFISYRFRTLFSLTEGVPLLFPNFFPQIARPDLVGGTCLPCAEANSH